MKKNIILIAFMILVVTSTAQKKKEVFTKLNYGGKNNGTSIEIKFEKGKYHNHPLFVIWLTDEKGYYLQTLFISESIGRGVFAHATRANGKWMEGKIQRPAALPYWTHQRNVINEFGTYNPTEKHPVIDAYTGATPMASFILHTKSGKPLNGKYKIMMELNQCWDWNEYWTNDKFPGDKEYKTSSQPAVVYSVDIDTNHPETNYEMKPIGHSHYSVADGSLTTDLSSLTTALKIAKKITVRLN